MNCNVCGTEIPAKSNYCPNCGNAIPKPTESSSNEIIHCKSCLAAFGVDTKYCPNCGLPVERNIDKRYPNMAYTGTGNVQDNTWYGSRYGEQYGKQDGWQNGKQNGFQYGTGSFYKQPFENEFVTVTYDTGAQNQIKSAGPAKKSEDGGGVIVKKRKFTPPEVVAWLMITLCFFGLTFFMTITDECPNPPGYEWDANDWSSSINRYIEYAGDCLIETLNTTWVTFASTDDEVEFYTNPYKYRERWINVLKWDYSHRLDVVLVAVGICIFSAVVFIIVSRVRKYATRKSFIILLCIWVICITVSSYFAVFVYEFATGNVAVDVRGAGVFFKYAENKEVIMTTVVGLVHIIASIIIYLTVRNNYKWPKIVKQ